MHILECLNQNTRCFGVVLTLCIICLLFVSLCVPNFLLQTILQLNKKNFEKICIKTVDSEHFSSGHIQFRPSKVDKASYIKKLAQRMHVCLTTTGIFYDCFLFANLCALVFRYFGENPFETTIDYKDVLTRSIYQLLHCRTAKRK